MISTRRIGKSKSKKREIKMNRNRSLRVSPVQLALVSTQPGSMNAIRYVLLLLVVFAHAICFDAIASEPSFVLVPRQTEDIDSLHEGRPCVFLSDRYRRPFLLTTQLIRRTDRLCVEENGAVYFFNAEELGCENPSSLNAFGPELVRYSLRLDQAPEDLRNFIDRSLISVSSMGRIEIGMPIDSASFKDGSASTFGREVIIGCLNSRSYEDHLIGESEPEDDLFLIPFSVLVKEGIYKPLTWVTTEESDKRSTVGLTLPPISLLNGIPFLSKGSLELALMDVPELLQALPNTTNLSFAGLAFTTKLNPAVDPTSVEQNIRASLELSNRDLSELEDIEITPTEVPSDLKLLEELDRLQQQREALKKESLELERRSSYSHTLSVQESSLRQILVIKRLGQLVSVSGEYFLLIAPVSVEGDNTLGPLIFSVKGMPMEADFNESFLVDRPLQLSDNLFAFKSRPDRRAFFSDIEIPLLEPTATTSNEMKSSGAVVEYFVGTTSARYQGHFEPMILERFSSQPCLSSRTSRLPASEGLSMAFVYSVGLTSGATFAGVWMCEEDEGTANFLDRDSIYQRLTAWINDR